jgi:hypothetical protein
MSFNEDGDPSPSPKHPSLDRIRNLNPLSITINE